MKSFYKDFDSTLLVVFLPLLIDGRKEREGRRNDNIDLLMSGGKTRYPSAKRSKDGSILFNFPPADG